ncbi:Cytochrome c556 [Bradyrhizobium erythrophlei]|jgi:cytochrome c556|uniref:Cytochrome c556 n=2 Tax=Bradyrhizobium erythrophlei TaxID=1437360 RepID=A0A1M7UIH5_9BRAD|nr:cytochrome c [Bradyrhizobium erythrophlei]SHN82779.1 Cytochrome c556 [Bradyrhizobium erythrophlei]
MMRTALVVGALLLGAGAVMAQQDLVKQNQDTMKANAKNLGAMVAMVKGEKPYDQATVTAGLAQLDETAKKLPTMFPDSIKGMNPGGDYEVSPKIWDDKAGFQAKIESFAKIVTEAKSKITDLDTLKVNAPAIGKECGGCHETFRIKKG